MSRKTSSSAPCGVVARGRLHGIAGVTQIDEAHALHHPAVFHVEAGNEALGEHQAAAASATASRRSTAPV